MTVNADTTDSLNRIAKLRLFHITRSGCVFILAAVVLRLALELCYVVYIYPYHSYRGFDWGPNFPKYIESWVIYLILVFLAPKRLRKPSDFFLVYLLFALFAPLLSLYALGSKDRGHLYMVVIGYGLLVILRQGKYLSLPLLKQGRHIAIAIASFGAIAVSAWLISSGGIGYFNLDFGSVYEYRRAAAAVTGIGGMGYITSWTYKVFGPLLLALALWKRWRLMTILVISLYVLWFGVSNVKSVAFYPAAVLGIWICMRRSAALSVVPLGLATVVILAITTFWVLDYQYVASLLVRRVFFMPAFNTFDYYEFFSHNELVWWSNSISSGFIRYPYHLPPADLLGQIRGTGAHVNNSFLSTGYMHAGLLGVFLYGIVGALLFRIIDSISKADIPHWVSVAVLFAPFHHLLMAADLPTAMITHGVLVSTVLLFLLRARCRSVSARGRLAVGNAYSPVPVPSNDMLR